MILNGITLERLADRRALLASFDGFRRDADIANARDGLDPMTERALGILTSSKLVDALDLNREDVRVRDRYGRGSDAPVWYGDASSLQNDHFLTARRLVEAGARCVTLAFGHWDWHHGSLGGTTVAQIARRHLGMLDQGISALVQDLHERGLARDVSVVVWGEFGRTPRINPQGGRDHWPQVSCALLAGRDMPGGQAIGATNRLGEFVVERPVHFQEVFATLYHNLGIDVRELTLRDLSGRPHRVLDRTEPMSELAGRT